MITYTAVSQYYKVASKAAVKKPKLTENDIRESANGLRENEHITDEVYTTAKNYRTEPVNLNEQIVMKIAKENPSIGQVIIHNLKNPNLPEGSVKMQISYPTSAGYRIVVHYVRYQIGNDIFYCDFKFVSRLP